MVDELLESSSGRVLNPKSPGIVPPQLPDTNRLGRRVRARWLVRLVHVRLVHARAREHALLRRRARGGRPPVRDTSMRMRASCRRLGNACPQVSSLWYPKVSSLYPVLSWCEKMFLAIFTRFSLFPFLISAVCVLPFNSTEAS